MASDSIVRLTSILYSGIVACAVEKIIIVRPDAGAGPCEMIIMARSAVAKAASYGEKYRNGRYCTHLSSRS